MTSPKYHIIVSGSRPEKGSDGKYLPLPKENIEFIEQTLAKVAPENYAFLYHGTANGVDSVADQWAYNNRVHVKQFPAYWFDPTKQGNVNKGAGLFRNEAMVRQALDDVFGKEDHVLIMLAFYNTAELKDSRGTNHAVEYATKRGVTVRTFQLPVQAGSTPATVGTSSDTMPDPFA